MREYLIPSIPSKNQPVVHRFGDDGTSDKECSKVGWLLERFLELRTRCQCPEANILFGLCATCSKASHLHLRFQEFLAIHVEYVDFVARRPDISASMSWGTSADIIDLCKKKAALEP